MLHGLVLFLLTLAPGCAPTLDPDDLSRRVAQAHPTWANYEEDLKAALGVSAYALWKGQFHSVSITRDELIVQFTLEGPWGEIAAGPPVLMLYPDGAVQANTQYEIAGNMCIYYFKRTGTPVDAGLPWVEVRYPHGKRRVAPEPPKEPIGAKRVSPPASPGKTR